MVENMVQTNSIRNEINSHRGDVEEGVWLANKGLIEDYDMPFEYELIKDWYRPGAESYILDFAINSVNRRSRIIAKACIKMCASESVREWMGRRAVVDEAGIATPELYSVKGACYLEEHIPFTLKEAYQSSDDENRIKLKNEFCTSYQQLFEAGFKPLSLHDARSRGSDIVLVDFGFDLGGISSNIKSSENSTHSQNLFLDEFERLVS